MLLIHGSQIVIARRKLKRFGVGIGYKGVVKGLEDAKRDAKRGRASLLRIGAARRSLLSPLPIPYLRHIFSVLGDVLLVLDRLVAHRLPEPIAAS